LKCIQEAIARVDDVIIAVGKGVETNKKAVERLNLILALLLDKQIFFKLKRILVEKVSILSILL